MPPSFLNRIACVVAGALLAQALVACERPSPAVGDAIDRGGASETRATIEAALVDRNLQIRIANWLAPDPYNISRDVEQSLVFSDNPDVIAVVGHAGSRASLLAAKAYNEAKLPQIVPNATGGDLWRAGSYTFPIAPSNAEQAELLVSYALDSLGASSVSLVYVGDTYGADMRNEADAAMKRRGHAFTTYTLVTGHECGGNERRPAQALARAHLMRAPSQVVILATTTGSGNCIATEMLERNDSVQLLFSDSGNPDVAARNWSLAEKQRVRRLDLWTPDSSANTRAFVEFVQNRTGRMPLTAEAFMFDAFALAATAIHSGVSTRDEMYRWLRSLGNDSPAFEGVTGPIHFSGQRSHRMRVVPIAENPA